MEVTSREEFENLKKLPFFRGVIVSDSMHPLIKVGDKIVVEVGNKELRRFDVVVILLKGRLVCHYVWTFNRVVTPFLLQTKNLHYGQKDHPVSYDEYLGKVISHKLSGPLKLRILIHYLFKKK